MFPSVSATPLPFSCQFPSVPGYLSSAVVCFEDEVHYSGYLSSPEAYFEDDVIFPGHSSSAKDRSEDESCPDGANGGSGAGEMQLPAGMLQAICFLCCFGLSLSRL